jgi:hypothetical protein
VAHRSFPILAMGFYILFITLSNSRLLSSPLVSSRLLSSPLVSSRLLSSPLVSSPIVSSRLLSSPLVSSRLLSSPLDSSRGRRGRGRGGRRGSDRNGRGRGSFPSSRKMQQQPLRSSSETARVLPFRCSQQVKLATRKPPLQPPNRRGSNPSNARSRQSSVPVSLPLPKQRGSSPSDARSR